MKQFQDNFLSKDNKNYTKLDHIQNLKYIFKFGVETVLELDKQAMHLSDHKPANFEEKKRIYAANSYIENNRVNGLLALSRALGDFEYKANSSLKPKD